MKSETGLEKEIAKDRVFEESEVPTDRVPFQNKYEEDKWNSNGFDQSGFKS